jgi:hypothetical protein
VATLEYFGSHKRNSTGTATLIFQAYQQRRRKDTVVAVLLAAIRARNQAGETLRRSIAEGQRPRLDGHRAGHHPKKGVATVAVDVSSYSAGIFRRATWQRMSFSDPSVRHGMSSCSSTRREDLLEAPGEFCLALLRRPTALNP